MRMARSSLENLCFATYNAKYSVETMSYYTHLQRIHKMLNYLLKWLTTDSHQSQLERFIISKQPTNAAEVEYWTREWENNKFVWCRGL